MFKVNNENTRKGCQWRRSGVFIVKFKHMSYFFYYLNCWWWTDKCHHLHYQTNFLSDKVFTTSCWSWIYTGSWKMFWRKGYRRGNWWRNKLMHCALITVHLVLEYNIIYFAFGRDLTLSPYCFISAAIIFPKTSSASNSFNRKFTLPILIFSKIWIINQSHFHHFHDHWSLNRLFRPED